MWICINVTLDFECLIGAFLFLLECVTGTLNISDGSKPVNKDQSSWLVSINFGLQIYNVMYTFKKHHHILSICMHVQARLDRSEGSGMCTICI